MPADPFVATLEAWMDVARRQSVRHFLHFARDSGLSMSHLGAIFHVHHIGSCGVTEVGDHLGVTSAAASQMLDRLVQQGLVQRSEDPDDRRVKRIVLTEKGQRLFNEAVRARQSWLDDLASTFSDREKDSIRSALELLITRVNEFTRPAVSI